MKTFMIAIASAVVGAFAVSSVSFADSVTYNNVCASEQDNGWVVTGIPAGMRDWSMTQVIGSSIGDGKCQDGWVMKSTVDPRIQGASVGSTNTETSSVSTLTGTTVDVVTNAATNRLTAEYQGYAPARLFNITTGVRKNLVGYDNRGRAIYVRLNGPKAGQTQKWSEAKLLDRSVRDGCRQSQRNGCHRLRYDASFDTTTTVQDFDVETTKTVTYTKTRTFCPSVWTYDFVAPNGDAAGTVQGNVGECVDERVTVTRHAVSNSTRSSTNIKFGDKYVTTQ